MPTATLHLRQFGKYEVIRKLGRGMSDVYLALDPDAERRVVLKLVEQCRDPLTQTIVEAERRGAAIQQELHAIDPRILEVYESGEQEGCFFVAMQYAEGQSVAEMLRRGTRFEAMRAARYAAEVASQLITLHAFQADLDGQRRAVIHGDIKPSNIQIGPNGEVWLLDFGIAKAITLTRNLTSHNLGSPGYCSPERIKNGEVNPQADLWALGVSLYEMIAGLPPYQAQSTRKLENLIQSRRPPRALPEDCPPALKAILAKALAGEIERRYVSASAFEADLRAAIDAQPTFAEMERQPSWEANATIQKAPDAPPSPVRKIRIEKWISQFNRFAIGLLLGMMVFMPAAYLIRAWLDSRPLSVRQDYARSSKASLDSDWQLYKRLEQRYGSLGRFSPVHSAAPVLSTGFAAAGNAVLDGYRDGSNPSMEDFDWEKAHSAFAHLLEMDSSDADARGKLALTEAYLALAKPPARYDVARQKFEEAAVLLPRSADPHLGLARVQIAGFHNVGQAIAEFRAAERLGFRSGPREAEEQADGFLYRGEQHFQARRLVPAQHDFVRARNLYEPIAGFSNVDRSLERLDRDEDALKKAQAAAELADRLKKKAQARSRRWR